MKRALLLLVLTSGLWACEKEEIPVEPFDRGGVEVGTLYMGPSYIDQVYFSLESQNVVGSHAYTSWDLAFEGGSEGWRILLNDARFMTSWKSPYKEFESAMDTLGYASELRLEIAATALTNPAILDWRETQAVYLIDLGYNTLGQLMGRYWIKVDEWNDGTYTISSKPYGSQSITNHIVPTELERRFTFYSLRQSSTVPCPADDEWTFKFTKYTYQFIDPPQPYLVAGVIINPNGVAAVEFSEKAFAEISASDTSGLAWSTQPDVIGYEWKYYSFDTGTYEVDAERTWLIRTKAGLYYKIRFTDFYDSQGLVGTPSFEFALI